VRIKVFIIIDTITEPAQNENEFNRYIKCYFPLNVQLLLTLYISIYHKMERFMYIVLYVYRYQFYTTWKFHLPCWTTFLDHRSIWSSVMRMQKAWIETYTVLFLRLRLRIIRYRSTTTSFYHCDSQFIIWFTTGRVANL